MAKANILKMDKVLQKNVHEVHMFLSYKNDLGKLKANLRKRK